MHPDWTSFPRTARAFEDARQQGHHLGAHLHVVLDGTLRISAPLGERRPGEALAPDTLFLWRSAGKPLTAVAIAQLWERQLLDLDEPVARYLPEFGHAGKEAVTVRHLLQHTGGFRTADRLPDSLSWEETIHAIGATPLEPDWIPGETSGYHTQSSWFILAELIQRCTGRPFPDHLREAVLAPLGMEDTWVGMPVDRHRAYGSRIGRTYLCFPGPPVPHPEWDTASACAECRPGSNARGPVSQLGDFYTALLAGGRPLLQPTTLATLTRAPSQATFDRTFRHLMRLGLGFVCAPLPEHHDTAPYGYGSQASDGAFGHSGAQSSCAFADPAHALVVAWACNGLPGEPRHQRRQRTINTAIYQDLGLA
jgi:CubicO group peptidase (beta-lactamase class C family)